MAGRSSLTALMGAAVVFAGICSPPKLLAQEEEPEARASAEQAPPVCMRGAWRDVPQVAKARRGQAIEMVVSGRDVRSLEKKGFAQVDCAETTMSAVEARAGWRDQICEMAAFGNEAVQNQFERALGARPAVLCGSAELVAGLWRGAKSGLE